ncbi:MAG: DUF397 domain-containing protein [Nocardiopsaceae bacterium]|nr:DUF397 domain-containing protein [Nocardiopsaceae bacterium]
MGDRTNWRKASHSGFGEGNCIEVAGNLRRIMVRDTKQARMGEAERTVITFSGDAWREFAESLRSTL